MIRVMIDRHIAETLETHYWDLIRRLLQQAVSAPGFISGETLTDMNDANHCIIWSTWRSEADWENWLRSPERKTMMEQLAPMLDREEKYLVLQNR